MKTVFHNRALVRLSLVAGVAACLSMTARLDLQAQGAPAPATPRAAPAAPVKAFDNPQLAANALVAAAKAFDVGGLQELFGPAIEDIVLPGEYAEGRQRATEFAAKADEKLTVSFDPVTKTRAFLLVGADEWPFPIPLVRRGARWSFDAQAGRQEIRSRRIGRNELDAIRICRGYVEAQHEYALTPREGARVSQYAQRIISTPGKQDGLAWRNSDGTWAGPVGEAVARALDQGYALGAEPYRGYFFKVLKAQGPAAPLGEMDYVVKDVMIGGFALVAAPAAYGVTGIQTFIVSHDGVVFEKDLGTATLAEFKRMERFNPDESWTAVEQP
jgi:hypothetical protein